MKINEVERNKKEDSNRDRVRMDAENFVGLHEDYNEKYQKKREKKKTNEITSNSFSAFDGHFYRRGERNSQEQAEVEARGQGLTII